MRQYLELLKDVLENGKRRGDRTGTGTISRFGTQSRYDLSEGFPAVTTKQLAFKSVVSELLWILTGSTDERELASIRFDKPASELTDKNTIWTANADKQGVALGYENTDVCKMLGPVYGYQWRHWGNDQIATLINGLKEDPEGRRHIVSAWNANEIKLMALPPCHTLFQFYVEDNTLSCQLYQRSADLMLGVPFNVASYALLTHIIAQECGLEVGEFVHTIGDAHIYVDHIGGAQLQIQRTPHKLPKLSMPEKIFDVNKTGMECLQCKTNQFTLLEYEHDDPIVLNMSA